uniref:Transmembrane protein n=1 Tax=Elaeophora elaphi TaxID=1147741 RepID=A0A0R3RP03_9BILA
MGSDSVHFGFLILIIINLFYVLYAQQLTPIIGDKCGINSPDVPIGGKETQFFLKCEQSLHNYCKLEKSESEVQSLCMKKPSSQRALSLKYISAYITSLTTIFNQIQHSFFKSNI